LGRVFHIGFRLRTGDGRGPEPYTVQPYFRQMPRLLVYETLVHFLDTMLYLGGEIESVYCRTQRLNPVIAGEDCAVVTVTFASGGQGVIDANRIAGPAPPPVAFGEMRLEGERGAMRMAPDGSLFRTAAYGEPELPHAFHKPETGYKGESAQATQRHIAACLRSGEKAECEGEQYLKTVKLVEACYESAAKAAVVKL
jgi:D-apiose dehydrogenase